MNLFSRLFNVPAVAQLDALQVKNRPGRVYLLDVRQPEEYREGHIAGSHLIPLGSLPQRMKELPRDREIICVCRTGSRSSAAARQLAAAGFKAANLRGGMFAWSRAGLPLKRGGA